MKPASFFTIAWRDGAVVMIDQRALPTREVYRTYKDYRGVARAITDMVIRGAPAIGVAAAMGIALGARQLNGVLSPRRLSACVRCLLRRGQPRSTFFGPLNGCNAGMRRCGPKAVML